MASKHSALQDAGVEKMISVYVSHSNLKQLLSQLRFSPHTSIEAVKSRLSQNTGTAVGSMVLQLFDEGDQKICDMADDTKPLGFYSPMDGYRIHIIDLDPASCTANGWLEDTSSVEKYTISEEDYEKRDDTFRKFKEKRLAEGQIWSKQQVNMDTYEEVVQQIHEGDRCEVNPGGKRGEVKFVGLVESLGPGYWVGVQFDEPVGKHDGMVKGKRYFSCSAGHGVIVRPDKVQVGDYPEIDPFDDVDEI
ncbi:hypothetical protein KP509_28G018600 [Ceratopteris richardii]|uniref:CAP-Gly domain-containing protein n=1 Tax=Ceratopteris richardii TaxID=49495 RepID=A0A8T2RCA3_CERRI|nr:hypothetical protein KP509_28G018600 [Ceratopteris richardii]KAH7293268.1 hypothetical protein KP509_28G018600 [Ceratopteris richardii]KAH7293269.1 hypothetical protein KP509_28G018600 [Ceratopteris richardii]